MFRTARPARRAALRPRGILVAGGLAAALVLSGCAAGQISQTADQVAAIDGANGNAGSVGVRNAMLATAPAAGYAKGANAPLLVTIVNDGLEADTLTQASSPAAASVPLASPIALAGQTLTTIGTDSKVTLTLTGLTAAIPYGYSVPVTFSFAKAGPVTVNVPIEIPAERSGERSAINIQPAEPTPLWETGEAGH